MDNWKSYYNGRKVSFEEAATMVQSGDVIGVALGIGACSPEMYDAILERHEKLKKVRIIDTLQLRPSKLYDPDFMANLDGHINYMPAFGIARVRNIKKARMADFLPMTGADVADKMARRSDMFLTMVTPPNAQGYVNLGLTNFYTMETIRKGRASGKQRLTIAEVNEEMPVVYGDNWMHVSEFDYFIEHNSPIPSFERNAPGEMEKQIAAYVLELIKDGDTLQMGIGGIPEAVISGLDGRVDLGVVSEMLPMGLQDLVARGIVNNSKKPHHTGISIATFCMGDQDMYNYVTENPACEFYPASYTNNPVFIAQHPNMVTINMALMVDLSGQIASEGIGHRMISGTGGQLDFTMGSYWSNGGRGMTLITSARKQKDGSLLSAIVPHMPEGTPVTVPRTYAQYVISEYGIANLKYKSRRERALELISIAHPDLRGELRKSLRKNFYPGNIKRVDTNNLYSVK